MYLKMIITIILINTITLHLQHFFSYDENFKRSTFFFSNLQIYNKVLLTTVTM